MKIGEVKNAPCVFTAVQGIHLLEGDDALVASGVCGSTGEIPGVKEEARRAKLTAAFDLVYPTVATHSTLPKLMAGDSVSDSLGSNAMSEAFSVAQPLLQALLVVSKPWLLDPFGPAVTLSGLRGPSGFRGTGAKWGGTWLK